MEEMAIQDQPGLLGRLANMFSRREDFVEEQPQARMGEGAVTARFRKEYAYTVTLRKEVLQFDDAYAAANGLKRGEQQILNLVNTEPGLRNKIVDFMAGVAFSQEGSMEAIAENVYLVVPPNAHVENAPATPRSMAGRN